MDELKRLQYSNSSNARDVFLYGCELAGSQYLDLEDHVVPKLHENDPLALMREPNNEFDEHAISVYTTGGLKLGYLPRSNNLILSRLMDEGNLLFGKTKTFHWDGKRLYLVSESLHESITKGITLKWCPFCLSDLSRIYIIRIFF